MRGLLLFLLPMWAVSTHGCQWLAQLDASRNAATAQADHASCVERGYSWPSESYLECRRFALDDRQREQWMELQMSRQQQQSEIGIQLHSPAEPYRPIRADNFECSERTTRDGESYIACFERTGSE